MQTVTASVEGRDIEQFERDARARIGTEVKLSDGEYVVYSGTARAQVQARTDLLLHSALAGIGIFLLLYVAFNNLHNLLITFVNLPFALIGGVIAVFASGGWMSLGSLVRVLTPFRLSPRHPLTLVSPYPPPVEVGRVAWHAPIPPPAAAPRLPPLLITALVPALR